MDKYEQLKKVIQEANPDKWNKECLHCLSSPIRLADVLLAIEESGKGVNVRMATNGKIGYWHDDETNMCDWNLRDDNLDHQSDETKEFLIDLLVK